MSLRTLEWLNVVWLGVVLLWLLPGRRGVPMPADTWQRSVAFVPVAGLLVAGGWYWHRKLAQVRDGRPLDGVLGVLHRVDRLAPGLLVVTTVAMAGSWVFRVGTAGDRGWATALLVLAWLEYVNYFRVQLMHDTRADLGRLRRTRRLRRSALARDLDRWRRRASIGAGP